SHYASQPDREHPAGKNTGKIASIRRRSAFKSLWMPSSLFPPSGLAFVDIETTGGPAQLPSITEIAVIQADEGGVREWSTLVRPDSRIPLHIERLTGISNDMVADAPRFEQVAGELFDRLHGRVFVA